MIIKIEWFVGFEPKWNNSNYIKYRVNSLRLVGLHMYSIYYKKMISYNILNWYQHENEFLMSNFKQRILVFIS